MLLDFQQMELHQIILHQAQQVHLVTLAQLRTLDGSIQMENGSIMMQMEIYIRIAGIQMQEERVII